MPRTYIRWPALAATLLLSVQAWADDDPRRLEAKRLFDDGVTLDAANRHEEALAKFEKAYAVYPSPNTLFNMAREEHLTGKFVAATRHYREALDSPQLSGPNREFAQRYLGELSQTVVGRIRVSAPAGSAIAIDGNAFTGSEPLVVLPGTHRIEVVHSPGHRATRDVEVARGETAHVEFRANDFSEGVAPVAPRPPEADAPSHSIAKWITAGAVGAAALVAAGIGAGFEVGRANAKTRASALDPGPTNDGCVVASARCDQYRAAREDQNGNTELARGFFIGAGVLAVATVGVLLLWPSDSKETSLHVRPTIGPRLAGASFDIDF